MNPILLCFADGTTFFIGLGMVLIAELLLLRFRVRAARIILTNLALIGIVFVVISATPVPIWAYLAWFIPAIVLLAIVNRSEPPRRAKIVTVVALAITTLGMLAAEIPYHAMPRIALPKDKTVYVLGDSISAGVGNEKRCWPEMLADSTGLSVVNLAGPGATVRSAIEQAKRIDRPGSLVIVELGGNDLLGGTKASDFHARLEQLVSMLRADRHEVILVELPLYPLQNAYGQAQRDVAARHDAATLPKRCFTKVLGMQDATLDGLHLSPKGHEAMARTFAEVFQKE